MNSTKELDDDYYDTLAASRRGEITEDEASVCFITLAYDYARAEDWERVGHMLLNIQDEFYQNTLPRAVLSVPSLEDCVISLAERLVEAKQVDQACVSALVVDLS